MNQEYGRASDCVVVIAARRACLGWELLNHRQGFLCAHDSCHSEGTDQGMMGQSWLRRPKNLPVACRDQKRCRSRVRRLVGHRRERFFVGRLTSDWLVNPSVATPVPDHVSHGARSVRFPQDDILDER